MKNNYVYGMEGQMGRKVKEEELQEVTGRIASRKEAPRPGRLPGWVWLEIIGDVARKRR